MFAKQRFSPVSPFVSLVFALPPRACVKRMTAERRGKNPLGVVQNLRNLTNQALVSSHTSWILCPTAVSGPKNQQVLSLHVVTSQTVGSRRSGTYPPREEPARTGRPGHSARHNPRGSRMGRQPSEHQLSPTHPVVRRSGPGQTAPPEQW